MGLGPVAGVDACRGGWVAVVLERGSYARALLAPGFGALLAELEGAVAVGVDIPIGLPAAGRRPADAAARAFVGPMRNAVFPTPPREALLASTYAEARKLVPSLSAQSYALRKKILEVEAHVSDGRIFEVHPEVSFAALAGRRYLQYSKRTWNGQIERRRLLAGHGIELPDEIGDAGRAGPDDVLDAAAAAWSANRFRQKKAKTLPESPPKQSGRAVAIWY